MNYQAIVKSLAEVFIGACIAQVSAGETDPMLIVRAGLGAVVVVVGRYVNPKDTAFGVKGK